MSGPGRRFAPHLARRYGGEWHRIEAPTPETAAEELRERDPGAYLVAVTRKAHGRAVRPSTWFRFDSDGRAVRV